MSWLGPKSSKHELPYLADFTIRLSDLTGCDALGAVAKMRPQAIGYMDDA